MVVSDKTFINNQDANIDKVPANIILNGLPKNPHSEQYDGNPYVITVTTKPLNLAYIVTYNGSTTPPTNAGTYTVVAMIDDNFYAASKTSTFIIEKAPRVINISNVNQTYDGNPKPVTVSIPSVNVNYTVTYNGSTTPPTNAGTYDVVVTINDINNENFPEKDSNGQPNLGSGRDTLKILPQTPTITAQCPSKTYGDADFTIPVNTVSNGAISYTINSGLAKIVNDKIRITGVGNLNVTITQAASGNYSAASVICSSITVSPKPLTVTGITANDKVQDATTTATLNTAKATLQGIIKKPNGNGILDDVTLDDVTSASGTFSDANVGEGKTVTISGLTISGADVTLGKYTVVQPTTTAAIKANTVSGTITMTNATVKYNNKPQPLDVSITPNNIPIKITYSVNNTILRVDRLLLGKITKLSGNDYPKVIGKYTVKAELDDSIPNDTTIYTVSTVTATLEITPIQGNVTFGPNIFYYDEKKQPVVILSQSPVGEDLTITYNSLPTVPSAIGEYDVNVKFTNPNIFYNNTVKLTIKAIPTNNCGTNIKNDNHYQQYQKQYQKNIIDFSPPSTGDVNFNYDVGLGAAQFTIEYPLNLALNSGTEIYNSKLRSVNYKVEKSVTDYVSGLSVTVTGGATPDNNTPFSFKKNVTGTLKGIDYDKCLITVYTPTNNNSWDYSISCVGASAPVLPTGTGIFLAIFIEVPTTVIGDAKYLGSNLALLESKLQANKDLGNILPVEHAAIIRIIEKYKKTKFASPSTAVLQDTDTNLKIVVNYFTNPSDGTVVITLQYKRLTDSRDYTEPGINVDDCHYYKYIVPGLPLWNAAAIADAKDKLISQIDTDSFKNTVSGGKLKLILKEFVGKVIKSDSYDKVKFKFFGPTDPSGKGTGKVVIYNTGIETSYAISMPNGRPILHVPNTDPAFTQWSEPEGVISIDTTNKTVEIIYPAFCKI